MVAKIEHSQRTGCPIACSLDIIGDHWTLLVVRNLMFLGVHEYKDMLACEEQISSSILTDRLKKLEQNGLISSAPHPKSQRRKLYYLTSRGKDLIYVLVPLVNWATTHIGDKLDIPPEKQALLDDGPDAFITAVLDHLDAWEREHLQGR